LNFRTAQSGDDEPGHNGRKNSGFGFDSRSDAERHGQRQGDDADGQPGDQIGEEIVLGVVF